jgi:hypothetical protein
MKISATREFWGEHGTATVLEALQMGLKTIEAACHR